MRIATLPLLLCLSACTRLNPDFPGHTGTTTANGGAPDHQTGWLGDRTGATDSSAPEDRTDPGATDTFETEDGTDTDGTDTDGTDTEDPSCPVGTHDCLEDAPPGWTGPHAIWTGPPDQTPPECPVGYQDFRGLAYSDLSVPEASCDCACGNPTGVRCEDVTLGQFQNTQPQCVLPVQERTLAEGECRTIDEPEHFWTLTQPGADTSAARCPVNSTTSIPAPTWQTVTAICGATAMVPGCMAGSTCRPTPPDAWPTRCISRDGDVPCPANSPYTVKRVVHAEFADGRECTACQCESLHARCEAKVMFASSCRARLATGILIPDDGCTGVLEHAAATYTAVVQGACDPVGGELLGAVERSGEQTLCCLP